MGISLGHLVVILIIVMVIWGPSRVGNLGKGIGEAIRGFKKGMNGEDSSTIDVTHTIREAQPDPTRATDSARTADPAHDTEKDKTRS